MNPQTGPFYVEGAEPGDTLALHVVDLDPGPRLGGVDHDPVLRRADRHRPHRDAAGAAARADLDLPARPRPGHGAFEAHRSEFRVELPIAPMLGTVGVAPAGREVRSSLVPDTFGGNMDTPEMRAGTTCYLGVNVEGALFSVGDGHYRQGEGESCGTAVEGAMDVDADRRADQGRRRRSGRASRHDDDYVVVGSARPLEDAWRASQVGMIALARRAVRAGPARRLPAAHPDQRSPRSRTSWTPTTARSPRWRSAAAGGRRATAACTALREPRRP